MKKILKSLLSIGLIIAIVIPLIVSSTPVYAAGFVTSEELDMIDYLFPKRGDMRGTFPVEVTVVGPNYTQDFHGKCYSVGERDDKDIPDIDGEPGDGFGHLTDPLGYGAGARYTFVPGGEATKEDCRAYVLKVMNAVKAISDDGELHGNKTNEMFDDIITEENFADVDNLIWELLNGFGFQYNGVYVDCYITADPSVFGVELAYALQ